MSRNSPYTPKSMVGLLGTGGLNTGTTDFTGDFSTPDTAYVEATSTTGVIQIQRMIIQLEDSNNSMTMATFGGITALTNGIAIDVVDADGNSWIDLTPVTWKSNSDIAGSMYDVRIETVGSGNDALHARWTYANNLGPKGIYLPVGWKLEMTLQDDYTGLVKQKYTVQGFYPNDPQESV
jgi:hypothetical protein